MAARVAGRLPPKGQPIDSRTKALLASQAALDKQAQGVVVMDLRGLSSVTDFFVICTAESPPQMNAIKDHVEAVLAAQGAPVWHVEGTAHWVLMDCGDLVVHLLDPEARTFYQLEQLWADAPRLLLEDRASAR